MTNLSKKL